MSRFATPGGNESDAWVSEVMDTNPDRGGNTNGGEGAKECESVALV